MLILNIGGNITGQPILRTVNTDTVINFTIAHNEKFKNRGGQPMERTTFIRCAIWNKPELMPMLFKGRAFTATGSMEVKMYNNEPQINVRVTAFQIFGKGQPKTESSQEHSEQTEQQFNHTPSTAKEVIDDLPF